MLRLAKNVGMGGSFGINSLTLYTTIMLFDAFEHVEISSMENGAFDLLEQMLDFP